MSFITELYGQVGSRGKHRVRKEALSKSLKGSGNHSRQNAAINSFRDWLIGRVVFAARHGFFQVERRVADSIKGRRRAIKDCFGERKQTRSPQRIRPVADELCATLTVLVAPRVLRLRRVSAVRRLRLQDRREDLHPARRVYRARRMIRDDWRVLCAARRFVQL